MNIVIFSILSYAALYDIKHHKIPNFCFLSLLIIFISNEIYLTIFTNHQIPAIQSNLIGLVLGLVLTLSLYTFGLFGAGDAKLLASLGFIVGYPNIVILVCTAMIFSSLLSLLRLLCYGEFTEMLKRWKLSYLIGAYEKPKTNSVAAGAVPMGGAILLAYIYCYFYLF